MINYSNPEYSPNSENHCIGGVLTAKSLHRPQSSFVSLWFWSERKMFNFGQKNKTFRPKKKIPKDTKQYELHQYAKATLGSGNLKAAVQLPPKEDIDEWLAVNTVDFFNQVNLLYGSISEFCTEQSCPVMSAGAKYEYHWADGVEVKKPLKVSAPEYVDRLMRWIQDQLDNEKIFPSTVDIPFPKEFKLYVKNIFRRMFRVYAHIYHHHMEKITSLGEEAHLNTCFKHFYYFIEEFDLVERREMAPLQDLIDAITGIKSEPIDD